jgi:hypothetical protein
MRFLLLLLLTGCSEEWAAQATVYIKADSTAAVVYENCEIEGITTSRVARNDLSTTVRVSGKLLWLRYPLGCSQRGVRERRSDVHFWTGSDPGAMQALQLGNASPTLRVR